MTQIIIAVITMTALGLIFGLGLAYALKLFRIEVDPTVALIISKLPGANCGACGKAGCIGFAEALKAGETAISGCVVTDETSKHGIAEILGIEYNPRVKRIATVLCNGGKNAKDKYKYRGIKNCNAATLVFGGYKECSFGCLGMGDCIEACPFDAIKIGPNSIPEVDMKRCTACAKCVKSCPKGLLLLVPIANDYYIKCSSKDPGNIVMKACKAGCIGCGKCLKVCPVGAISINDNLSVIDYDKCTNCGECNNVCPTNAIGHHKSADVYS